MVDKFVDSEGKVVLEISDENEMKVDPRLSLKLGESCKICDACSYATTIKDGGSYTSHCDSCGSAEVKRFRRVDGEVYEMKENDHEQE